MQDLGGPMDNATSDAKFNRYALAWKVGGLSRWLIEIKGGPYIGYCGVLPARSDHPLGEHFEIGWRLVRFAWGQGYATESSKAALADAFARSRVPEVLAYTAPDNLRSQAVMERLKLQRDPSRDFSVPYSRGVGIWRGLVWVARP